ncbi:hypothetical protein EHS25_003631 [Saitozyma podzolica]|uniref:Uncharacterized protein n=1 Tax=Saitozyma podzolica TaxID=1890683 RepID=A0A427Y7S4_9TREE|nr:hypothetical protein EHS25_003631 [Saitozyma podzolica]
MLDLPCKRKLSSGYGCGADMETPPPQQSLQPLEPPCLTVDPPVPVEVQARVAALQDAGNTPGRYFAQLHPRKGTWSVIGPYGGAVRCDDAMSSLDGVNRVKVEGLRESIPSLQYEDGIEQRA